MKDNFTKPLYLITYLLLILLRVFSPGDSKAIAVFTGPATYTNGSASNTFPLNCGDMIQLPLGGTLTFQVYAVGDITDLLNLNCPNLPAGATFPPVSGLVSVVSTFTWTPPGAFSGVVDFNLDPWGTACSLFFDWPLPVELTSFTSDIYGNSVTLRWQTASEKNNSGFQIERSKKIKSNLHEWIHAGAVTVNGNSTLQSDYIFRDKGLSTGIYEYRLKQSDLNGNFEYHYLNNEVVIGIPVSFDLAQNYPNPFNPSTSINFDLPDDGHVTLKVFNVSGKEVATIVNDNRTAGYYTVKFNASGLSSGIYYYRLESNGASKVMKMAVIK